MMKIRHWGEIQRCKFHHANSGCQTHKIEILFRHANYSLLNSSRRKYSQQLVLRKLWLFSRLILASKPQNLKPPPFRKVNSCSLLTWCFFIRFLIPFAWFFSFLLPFKFVFVVSSLTIAIVNLQVYDFFYQVEEAMWRYSVRDFITAITNGSQFCFRLIWSSPIQ